jgi:hypothetical protein
MEGEWAVGSEGTVDAQEEVGGVWVMEAHSDLESLDSMFSTSSQEIC